MEFVITNARMAELMRLARKENETAGQWSELRALVLETVVPLRQQLYPRFRCPLDRLGLHNDKGSDEPHWELTVFDRRQVRTLFAHLWFNDQGPEIRCTIVL